MSGVIDTLQVVFTADTGDLISRLGQISARISAVGSISEAAAGSVAALGSALTGGLYAAGDGAFAAGAAVGAAFASGILSAGSDVSAAGSLLSAAALSALSGVTPGADIPVSGLAPDALDMAAGNAANVLGSLNNVVIPINLDGVKLGEACLKSMDMVSAMTGHTRLSV